MDEAATGSGGTAVECTTAGLPPDARLSCMLISSRVVASNALTEERDDMADDGGAVQATRQPYEPHWRDPRLPLSFLRSSPVCGCCAAVLCCLSGRWLNRAVTDEQRTADRGDARREQTDRDESAPDTQAHAMECSCCNQCACRVVCVFFPSLRSVSFALWLGRAKPTEAAWRRMPAEGNKGMEKRDMTGSCNSIDSAADSIAPRRSPRVSTVAAAGRFLQAHRREETCVLVFSAGFD
jgi:hypothetical protein